MKWLIGFIMVGALLGCVNQTMLSSGTSKPALELTVYKGKTTEADVIAVLGQPAQRLEQESNGQITTRLHYDLERTGVCVNFTVCETSGSCRTNLVGPLHKNRVPRPSMNALQVTFIQNGTLIRTHP